jgi:hypothetical protein
VRAAGDGLRTASTEAVVGEDGVDEAVVGRGRQVVAAAGCFLRLISTGDTDHMQWLFTLQDKQWPHMSHSSIEQR